MASERDDLTIHFQSSIEKLCEDHEDQFDKWHAERGYTTGRAKWKARALAAEATIARLEAEVEAGKRALQHIEANFPGAAAEFEAVFARFARTEGERG